MSNPFFRFRQFTVRQERCAMKVSTDACIQGAWTPAGADTKRILDIGTGTGLLSLMLAQRASAAVIDALELDWLSAEQADENVAASPFAGRINVVQTDAAQWRGDARYDLLICNPPFFQNALKGPDAARNAARHSLSLHPDVLIRLIFENLSPDGAASLLWPKPEHEVFAAKAAAAGLSLCRQLNITHRSGGKTGRVVSLWMRGATEERVINGLCIKGDNDEYTEDFIRLLSPFYLTL